VGSVLFQYKILSTPLDMLGVRHISSQILTNQEPGQIVQRNFSHSICLESILCIGLNWQEIFPDKLIQHDETFPNLAQGFLLKAKRK
jgi:hypothetical protein